MCIPLAAIGVAMGATAGTATATAVGAAAVATTVAGIGMSAYSAIASGESQRQAANYNAKVQENAAADALQRGADAAAERRSQTRQLMSQQVTGNAAAGISSNTGTALDLLSETAGYGELDALRIVNNSQRQAYGMQAQAELDRYQGGVASRTGKLNAGASLLSGASNAFYGMRAGQYRTI